MDIVKRIGTTLRDQVPWRYVCSFSLTFIITWSLFNYGLTLYALWKFLSYAPALDFSYPLLFDFQQQIQQPLQPLQLPSATINLHKTGWYDGTSITMIFCNNNIVFSF